METVLQKRGNKSTGENSVGVTIAAVLLACLVASIASQAGLGAVPTFRVPSYRLQSVYEMPLVLLLGVLGGCVSSAFVYSSQVGAGAALWLLHEALSIVQIQQDRGCICA